MDDFDERVLNSFIPRGVRTISVSVSISVISSSDSVAVSPSVAAGVGVSWIEEIDENELLDAFRTWENSSESSEGTREGRG